jgi:hypothetical protein
MREQKSDNQELSLERVIEILKNHDINICDVEKILNGYFNPNIEISLRRDECLVLELLKQTKVKLLSVTEMNNELQLFLSEIKQTEAFYDWHHENEFHKIRVEYSNNNKN